MKVGFVSSNVKTLGENLINILSDVMWFLDGNHKTLSDRGCAIPDALQHFSGYYKPASRKRKKVQADYLTEAKLRDHYTALLHVLDCAFMKREMWTSVKEIVTELANSLLKYATYLSKEKDEPESKKQKATDKDTFEVLVQKNNIAPGPYSRYKTLHSALMSCKPYEHLLLNEYAPGDARRRHEYIKNLVMPVKCIKYTYSGAKEHLTFLWRVETQDSESVVLSKNMNIVTNIKKSLPVDHTKAMRREFLSLFGRKIDSRAGFLREAYRRLTGDCRASINAATNEVDKRIADILEHDDPDLICDLRVNNGRPEQYDEFLWQCQKHIISSLETAVDDRRHDKVLKGGDDIVTHFADAFSVSDFYEQVKLKCPANTPVASKQWLKLQFWPRNTHHKSSERYSGRLKVKFMIQSRQFRHSHEDMHYASALFRYEKEFCIKYREHCSMVCMDDKHKLKVGEPGYPVAAAERGKAVLIANGKTFEVGDHDFTKFSITPSVTLKVDIPSSIDESF
ncbi:uncharacterized protein LOC132738865 [Ruditapes philippinarum]|uniref:uncharacterized protein LOC132738865 n=1 Tax=Ruditapes philippinarum TaxID=129788 RepID=UPI00295B049D|nr:uncharacterized protein LOC132738865 [Ruditapes philippinarum]